MTLDPLVSTAHATPFGEVNVLVTPEDGVVRAAGFRPLRDVAFGLRADLSTRGWVAGEAPEIDDAVVRWLGGDADAIATVPVDQPGGPFFQEVWAALRSVPGGQVVSYGELAQMAGRPRAMRAVGTACARNGIAPFVPCHRVIQSGGRLGSYGFGGMAVKAAMLEHEGLSVPLPHPDARVTAAR
ncbi:methylated-DNA--[protein]-cysteine S-methyltransferase [Demequina sp. SO4-13]|uniref:methylated-DNA--[protein]-cysteine S-methyltransferase n=1 Tax=Demequina sp. SO4-13 TaxID=3401027 RepID=UPI003AF5D762